MTVLAYRHSPDLAPEEWHQACVSSASLPVARLSRGWSGPPSCASRGTLREAEALLFHTPMLEARLLALAARSAGRPKRARPPRRSAVARRRRQSRRRGLVTAGMVVAARSRRSRHHLQRRLRGALRLPYPAAAESVAIASTGAHSGARPRRRGHLARRTRPRGPRRDRLRRPLRRGEGLRLPAARLAAAGGGGARGPPRLRRRAARSTSASTSTARRCVDRGRRSPQRGSACCAIASSWPTSTPCATCSRCPAAPTLSPACRSRRCSAARRSSPPTFPARASRCAGRGWAGWWRRATRPRSPRGWGRCCGRRTSIEGPRR